MVRGRISVVLILARLPYIPDLIVVLPTWKICATDLPDCLLFLIPPFLVHNYLGYTPLIFP